MPDNVSGACGTAGCGGCGVASTSRSFTFSPQDGAYPDRAAFAPGGRAELSVAVAGLSASAMWAFGVPLAGMIGGAWAGAHVAGPLAGEPASVLLGFCGLVTGLAWFRGRSGPLAAALAPRVRIATQPRADARDRADNGADNGFEVSDDRRSRARSEVRR
jgi:hypothetical protein